jgi:hypothetical protein
METLKRLLLYIIYFVVCGREILERSVTFYLPVK